MSQNTTAQNILKIVKSAIVIQVISISAYADGTCSLNKSDIAEDMQKIVEKLSVKYGKAGFQNAAYSTSDTNKIYDDQQLKVDRTDKFLKQVNAVGIISDGPKGARSEYASAVMISPCHVLVNAHGVTNKEAKQGKAPVYISLGQNSCESPNEFAHQDMAGKVIAIGDTTDGSREIRDSKDYAIVRIKEISDIAAPVVSTEFITINDSLATVGFPLSSTYNQKTGLRYPTLNFTRKTAVGTDGTFETLNKEKLNGSSGAGVFILDQDENGKAQMVLGGIIVGRSKDASGGTGLQTAAIIQHLKATNIKAYNEIKAAIQNNSCS